MVSPKLSRTTTTTSSSSTITMPSQLQQHHDNGVRDDINVVTTSITENTMNIGKNTQNNQLLFNNHDPQNQQHQNCTVDQDMMIVENNHHNHNNNRIDDNKSNNNNNNDLLLLQSSSKIKSTFPRRKSSVLDISSLLCELPANLSVNNDSSSVDEDSGMDDVSSHLGDTESLGSPRSFHKNSSTPATTPPYSPPGGGITTTLTTDREKRLINNNNLANHSQLDHHNERYMDTPWKRPRMMSQDDHSRSLVLPPITSFTSDLRSDSNNNDNEQLVHPSPNHGKINSPVDRHSSQKSLNHLEQFAAFTEAFRSNSSSFSHADLMDNNNTSTSIRLPPASSLTTTIDHSYENEQHHRNFPNNTSPLRRSSFDAVQTRYNPYTPPTLNPYAPPRLLPNLDQRRHSDLPGFTTTMSTSPRNDHLSIDNSYASPYGYDRGDVNRHYAQQQHQQRSSYVGMHSPSSPNAYHHHGYSMSSHNPYPTPPSTHHHLQMSHHHHLGSPYMDPTNSGAMVKAKRKRANANQLKVLNQVFQHTFFPSTELRIQLGKQLGMSPRTVQIWFQNKRQSWRSKSRATTNSSIKDDDGQIDDGNLDVEGNVNNNSNSNGINKNLVSRRSSNSSLSCSDEDETGRRSIPDSPMENVYSRGDYFTRNNSNESVNMTSNGNVTSTQNSYFAQPHSPNSNGDYYHHHRSNSGESLHHNNSGVITPTSPLPPSKTQLPSPVYSNSSSSTTERLPTFTSSFAQHTSSYHNTASTTSNSYDPFASNRLPAPIMVNHRHQQSYGYQSTVSSGI